MQLHNAKSAIITKEAHGAYYGFSCVPWIDMFKYQTPLSMGILQARILEWVVMSSCRGSSQPRDWTQVSRIAGRFFTVSATKKARKIYHLGLLKWIKGCHTYIFQKGYFLLVCLDWWNLCVRFLEAFWCHLLVWSRAWVLKYRRNKYPLKHPTVSLPSFSSVFYRLKFPFNFRITSLVQFDFLELSVTRFQVWSDSFCYYLICYQSPFSVTEIQSRKVDAFPNRWVTKKMFEFSKGNGSTPSWWISWANKALFVTLSEKNNLQCVFCLVQEIGGGWFHFVEFGNLLFGQYLLFC